jgi:hypothetical protein
MGLKMEHGRESQDPHEPDNLFIYKQLKLIQFWYNPLRMSLKIFSLLNTASISASKLSVKTKLIFLFRHTVRR